MMYLGICEGIHDNIRWNPMIRAVIGCQSNASQNLQGVHGTARHETEHCGLREDAFGEEGGG